MYNQGYRPQQQRYEQPAPQQPYIPPYTQQPPYAQQPYPQQPVQQPPYDPQQNWYAPPPQPSAPKGKKGQKQPKPRKKRSLKWQLVKLLLVLILFAAAGAGAYVWKTQSDVKPYMSVFLPNISVDGIDLSGRTWAEGSQLVWNQVQSKQNGWYIRLRNASGNYKDITAETLGISFDPTAALEQAWAIGHDSTKTIFELSKEIEWARRNANAFSSAEQSADLTPIDQILSTLEAAAYRAPSDAYLVSFNPDDAENPFTYVYETYGQQLNTTAIREQIVQMVHNLQSGEILLETELIYPSVTVDQLSQTVALRSRAITPIASNSTQDRTENIRIAFGKINGMQMENGDRFSFNSVVGRREYENGFLPAIEYAYGLEQWGWGGGVCQASSTLYIAAVQSGMTILNREPHSMAVSYTKLGMDATVSDTRGREIDFTFKNESGGTIYIAAHVISSPTNKRNLQCEVRIYGPSLSNVTYELFAEVTQNILKPTEPIYKADKEGDYVTYLDETKTIKGRDGYVVDSYRITYVDGVEIARDKLYTDTYPEKADTVYTGVKQRGGS